eukprot:1897757-Pyramimonas_sp.AAC.1
MKGATAQIRESKAQFERLNAQLACLRPEPPSREPPESEPESVVHWAQGLKGALTKEFACLSPEGNKQLEDGFSVLEGMLLTKMKDQLDLDAQASKLLEGAIQKPLMAWRIRSHRRTCINPWRRSSSCQQCMRRRSRRRYPMKIWNLE